MDRTHAERVQARIPVKFTLNLPMASGRFQAIPPDQYLDVAIAAEEAGFDHVSVPDNVMYPRTVSSPYPYSADGRRVWSAQTPCIDPWVAIPAMAAVTSRIGFFSNVTKLAIREPILVAKTVGSAACLSGERVSLGVGLSWMAEEFRALHQEMRSRGARADEAIEVIRALLAGGMVEYHGKHYDFEPLQLSPAPQRPVPIFVGGVSKAALRRAARLGDGWISMLHDERELRDLIAGIHSWRREFGREGSPFEIKVLWVRPLDRETLQRLESLGVTDLLVTPWLAEGSVDERIETKRAILARFGRETIQARR
jgi:probable F420-dependent oxidoreductase